MRPRSITGLIIAGFVVVATPLIVAIGASVFYVEQLHHQSERLVMQGVAVTRDSKRLNTLLIGMERSARQYRVLGEPALRQRFEKQSAAFSDQLDALSALSLNTLAPARLTALNERVAGLAHRLGTSEAQTNAVIDELGNIRRATDDIGRRGAAFVRERLDRLQSTAGAARRFLLICLFALVPAVIALGVFVTAVITRPLRQILDAVEHLGTGRMADDVRITAPAVELDRIGDRLDWMRRRLASQEHEKQQFLRHMSHELKTPLASIREGAELFTDGSLGKLTDGQYEVADIMGRSSLELASLIDNLLNFTAWREQHARLEASRFDLTALIARLVARQQLTIGARGLVVHTPREPIEITADIDRMQLIVGNLLANAVKYAPQDGIIRIEVRRERRVTDLYVRDNGPGVAAADRERIFEPFIRGAAGPAAAPGVEGTGIGLSVVRDCARAHGGEVAVVSIEGDDSVFHVRIPDICGAE